MQNLDQLSQAKQFLNDKSWAKAGQLLHQVISSHPTHAEAHYLMGITCIHLGHTEVASQWIYKAIQLNPNNPQYRLQLAECYQTSNHFDKAIHYYLQVLEHSTSKAQVWMRMAEAYLSNTQNEQAIKAAEQALNIEPNMAIAENFLGNYYMEIQPKKSIEHFKNALKNEPKSASVYYNLGNAYQQINAYQQSIQCYQTATKLKPKLIDAYLNWGSLLTYLKHYSDAEKLFLTVIRINSQQDNAYYYIGNLYREMDQQHQNESYKNLRQAFQLKPTDTRYFTSYYHSLQVLCHWQEAETCGQNIADKFIHSPLCALFDALSMTDNKAALFAVAKANAAHVEKSTQHTQLQLKHDVRDKNLTIRIGYVSSDFKDHPTAYLILGLLREHNSEQFDIYCYSHITNENDPVTQAVQRSCDHFIDITQQSDEECAKRIYQDNIDILIDLNGHTMNSRLGVFSLKPAPIQATYLGCPATTGMQCMDYIITDRTVCPMEDQPYYTEKLAYLPNTYQATDDQQPVSGQTITKQQLGLPENSFVFACFNQTYKLDKTFFNLWMTILKKTHNSVIWLYTNNPIVQNNLILNAEEQGVDKSRLIFAPRVPRPEHLQRQQFADLILDTQLYNGHTTTSEALWMGIPVVTLQGKSFPSRVASSLLKAINLTETITHTIEDYQATAVDLANNPEKLNALKKTLKHNKHTTPLFQTNAFTQHLEQLYLSWL
ncbi:MAG: tetratricopeptide repeat protein [Methylococcales bacterium]|jgi:protein O-GlcNAc transferase|nr:tetratricopeptide repeat protein [Methylococcales bacterium]MBT7444266.1 tetratricopeptide repeat protein [Methylococcales bacterium]